MCLQWYGVFELVLRHDRDWMRSQLLGKKKRRTLFGCKSRVDSNVESVG